MASTSTSTPPSIPDQVLPLFARSVLNLLHIWPALRIALNQGWGNSQSITILAEDVVDLFYSTATCDSALPAKINPEDSMGQIEFGEKPQEEDVQDVLLHVTSHAFGISLEDQSEVEVSKDLIRIWNECVRRVLLNSVGLPFEGDLLEGFERLAIKAKEEDGRGGYSNVTRGQGEDDGDSSSDEEGDDSDEEMGELVETTEELPRRRNEPEIDEDGFQMVTKKGGRR